MGLLLVTFVSTQDIDSEVAQHLKRLSRKDPITKVIYIELFVVFNLQLSKAFY